MKKCFTINPYRSTEDFQSYHSLLKQGYYQAIEIFYPYILEDEAITTYTNNVKEIMAYTEEVVMHLPFGLRDDLCNIDDFDAIIKRMKHAIDYGKQFNVEKYTLHLGYLHKQSREKTIKHIIEVLKDLCIYVPNANIMIENMASDSHMGHSPWEILDIIQKVNLPNIKFILDTGHANISSYTFEEYIQVLKPYLYHIHINDNNGIRDEHIRIGLGNINFNDLLKQLDDYQEYYCLEILYNSADDLINYHFDLEGCL